MPAVCRSETRERFVRAKTKSSRFSLRGEFLERAAKATVRDRPGLDLPFRKDFGDPPAVGAGEGDRVELSEGNPREFGGEFSAWRACGVDRFGDLEARDRTAFCREQVGAP